jgi:hypothetical protein
MLVKATLELPGFSTLNAMASQLRGQVNSEVFERITGRLVPRRGWAPRSSAGRVGPSRTTAFNRLKQSAGRASWSAFREQVAHMAWLDSLGDTAVWLEGIAESKIADFAGEAWAADAAVMGDVAGDRRRRHRSRRAGDPAQGWGTAIAPAPPVATGGMPSDFIATLARRARHPPCARDCLRPA